MTVSKNELIQESSNTTYDRGEMYFRRGRVKLVDVIGNSLRAEVRGSAPDKPYKVSLAFTPDKKRLQYSKCTCPAFKQYLGICKHIIATVLAAQAQQEMGEKGASVGPPSDNGAKQLLTAYITDIADKANESHAGQAKLTPVLEWDSRRGACLFFRVGEKRMYIVSDLGAFFANFRHRATTSYGKFALWHHVAAFEEESRPLVEFFLRHYEESSMLGMDRHNYLYYGSSAGKRNMRLSPSMADELFALLENKTITVRDSERRESVAPVKREDFRPRLRLQKVEGGGELDIVEPYRLVEGAHSLHVHDSEGLHSCSEVFSQACSNLLFVLDRGKKLFFADKDVGLLFSTVLPQVEAFVRLESEGDFESFQPLPLETKIYLDCPDESSVSARMTFGYGEKTITAFGENKDLTQSQDLAGELAAENLLLRYFPGEIDEKGVLRIGDDPEGVYRLLTEGLGELAKVAAIYSTDAFGRIKLRPVAVAVGVRMDAGLLRLDFDLEGVDLLELPEILASYRLAKKYHRLRDGSLLALEESALGSLSELAEGLELSDRQLASGHAEMTANRALYVDSILGQSEEIRLERDQHFKRILRDMREVKTADFPIPESLRKILRNYQKDGFRWLKTIAAYGFGGILADDMGLGKTLQILALLQSHHEENPRNALPSIVVCPSSLSLNWESEARKFTSGLRTIVVGGNALERAAQIARHGECDLLITSYDLLKRDLTHYEGIRFAYIVLDEAQYIKNQSTQNARGVKALRGDVRFALTGTPVENSLAELWSIFDFLMPGYLAPYSRFRKKYEEPIVKNGSQEAAERLKQLVRPFLLRRVKKDVLKELPPKTETVLRAPMEEKQKKVYAAHLLQTQKDLAERTGLGQGQERIAILAALTRMRQICCDPSLVYENYDGSSAKLEACIELIESCVSSQHRLLLFSQFTSMLDILQGRLTDMGLDYLRIDGSTKPSRRLEMVNAFNEGNTPVFLISLKAGGTGLNLTGADVVIHYDPWWNLSAQNQATDRAHRIGQKSRVQVYKLIAKDSIEERILEMQEKKSALVDAVIEDGGNPLEKLNREDLLALLE